MDTKSARKVYLWLWLSPILTIPTLLFVSLATDIGREAILSSAGWHLLLLIPALGKKDKFRAWHGRQALFLAGLRTLVVLVFYEIPFFAFFALLAIWFFGTLWGQKEAKKGESTFMRWFQRSKEPKEIEFLEYLLNETANWEGAEKYREPYLKRLEKLRPQGEKLTKSAPKDNRKALAIELAFLQSFYNCFGNSYSICTF